MKHKPTKSANIHPRAQIIITGTKIDESNLPLFREALGTKFPIMNWVGADGSIGHIDSIQPGVSLEALQTELERIAMLKFLDIGITVMSGPPGNLVSPVVSFLIKNGSCAAKPNVHMAHPPPRRIKTAIV
jgi:hypothetical protein